MPLELKATASLDHKLTDDKGKALPHPLTELTVSGEFLPAIPIQHHILAALLGQQDHAVTAEFTDNNGVLTFKLTVSHDDDMVVAGKEAHDLELEAANQVPPITVPQLIEKKAKAEAKAQGGSQGQGAEAAAKVPPKAAEAK